MAESANVVKQTQQTTQQASQQVANFTPAKEFNGTELINRVLAAKAAGNLRGLGNGASLRAFQKLIPDGGDTLDGLFTYNGKAFERPNADGTVTFYMGGQFELNGKKVNGRLTCNGVYSTSRASLEEIENPQDLQMVVGNQYKVYIEHRSFVGNDGKNVVYIPAYAVVG